MKRSFIQLRRTLSVLFIATIISFTASAQIDISARLIKPATGGTIVKGVGDSLIVMIKNVGSMPVSMMDTIGLMITIDGSSAGMYGAMAMLNPGDSGLLTVPNFSYSAFTANKNNANFCAEVMILGNTDPTMSNNTNCHTVNLRLSTTGIDNNANEHSITVYPNPASNIINISSDDQLEGSLQVFDMTGKLVVVKELGGTNTTLSVDAYSNGLYLYKLNDKNGQLIRNGKLIIAH